MLLNRDRASALMEAHGLDGLVALTPINVYYLSDHLSLGMRAGFDNMHAAVLPLAEDKPAALTTPPFNIRNIVNDGIWVENIVVYTSPPGDGASTPGGGAPYTGWPTRDVPLSERAEEWVTAIERYTQATSTDNMQAIIKAIGDADLAGGTLGVDDERLVTWLADAGLRAKLIPARDVFNEIRLVKSDDEIALLRKAASLNEHSVLSAIDALHEGAVWNEIETVYMREMAAGGGQGRYLACGAGGLQTGQVVQGEPVMFDGLGQYRGYHGDFGRSTVMGEPGPDVVERVEALEVGWQTAYEMIRPGVRYSEIIAEVSRAVEAKGFPGQFRPPVVHSLGLQHTDDPAGVLRSPGNNQDRALEENMVINVDLPHLEIGWGAVHLEDTVRVTATGAEALTSMETQLRVIAA